MLLRNVGMVLYDIYAIYFPAEIKSNGSSEVLLKQAEK